MPRKKSKKTTPRSVRQPQGPSLETVLGATAGVVGAFGAIYGLWKLFQGSGPTPAFKPKPSEPPGSWRCVATNWADRCEAIQHLLRPGEVTDVVMHLRSLGGDFVAQAAQYTAETIKYEPDPAQCDRWSTPAYTLKTKRGDCDDFAILLASILLAAGMNAVVVIGTSGGSQQGHAWVEGEDAGGWFFAEPQNGKVFAARPVDYIAEYQLGLGICEPCLAA